MKKLTKTHDAHLWYKKWSTWLALLAAMAASALAVYATFPERLQGLIPDWVLVVLGAVAMLSAFLVPLATSLQQSNLTPPGGE